MVLKVKNLKKIFDTLTVWNNLNASINRGEIVSIQGKSGEGKTTFLRCINNLEKVDGGSIEINGEYLCQEHNGKLVYADNRQLRLIRREIGMVFQNFNLFPHMTLMENITQAPKLFGEREEEIKERASILLNDLELLDKKDLYPYQLSGGQKQRAAIARACMLSPKLLCFDEPTSALDEETRGQIEEIIEKLSAKGISILIVTHDKEFAKNISHRILHIEDGEFREEVLKDIAI